MRAIEDASYEDNPPIFREYISAPNEEKHFMDNQFKNLKTNARLLSKAMWYEWRSKLLDSLKDGLVKFEADFDKDDARLQEQEELLAKYLPELVARHKTLQSECHQLQTQADESSGPDREELAAARERIAMIDSEVEEKRRLVDQMQGEIQAREGTIELVKERKLECAKEIKEAERVCAECRGWSRGEIAALKCK